jgi:hypothetical protein
LRALAPRPGGVDRDYVMYHAGRAAAPRPGPRWPAATGVLAVAVVVLGWAALHRQPAEQGERIVERIVPVPQADPRHAAPEAAQEPAATYAVGEAEPFAESFRLRQRVLRDGEDGRQPRPQSQPATAGMMLEQLLDVPRSSFDDATRQRLEATFH